VVLHDAEKSRFARRLRRGAVRRANRFLDVIDDSEPRSTSDSVRGYGDWRARRKDYIAAASLKRWFGQVPAVLGNA